MKKLSYFILFMILFFIQAKAQIALPGVEVVANTNSLYSELGRKLIVIDQTEIQKMAVQSVDALLNYVAGVDIRQRGVGGTQADISIRGGSFDQVLILLNGINITDPQTGHYNLDFPVNVADIVRVEILQGSSARLLGANAFSGAINIVTKKGDKKELNTQISAGSFGTFGQNVSGGFSSGKLRTFASVSHQSSDGYINNTDYDQWNAYGQLTLNTKNTGDFNLQLAAQTKEYGANEFYSFDYPNQFDATKTYFASLNWNRDINGLKTEAQLYWRRHHDRFELFRNFEGSESYPWYTGHNYHLTDVSGGKAVASYNTFAGKFSLGIDIRNEHIFSNVLGKLMDEKKPVPGEKDVFFLYEDNRLLSTAFFDYAKTWNKWYLSIGAAATYSEIFKTNAYGGFDLAYSFNEHTKAYLGFNSAVRLPTFTDLYYKSATQIANPNLKPERAYTPEIGLKANYPNWKTEAVVYYRIGKNVIDWIKQPDSTKWESRNLTDVNAFGFDISGEYRFNSFINKVALQYSFLQLDKDADNYDSKYALDYLKHKIVASVDHSVWKNLSATWKVSFYDRSGDYTYTEFGISKVADYKPYFLLDARLIWAESRVDVFADFNNIFDTKYADFGGLIQPGFNFNVGIRMKL